MSRRKIAVLTAGTFLWLIALGAGFAALQHYAATAGESQEPGAELGKFVAQHRRPGHGLVVMAVHPRCPCTDASLAELSDLLARSEGTCDAILVEYQPDQPMAGWPAVAATRTLGGVTVRVIADTGGGIARALGAQTSGHVVFADATGAIRFHGGITLARGHRGRSPAHDAILATLAGRKSELASTPVYGCPLTHGCTLDGACVSEIAPNQR